MTTQHSKPHRPTAIVLDDDQSGSSIVEETPDVFAAAPAPPDGEKNDEELVETAQERGILKPTLLSWGGLFWSALTSLLMLALGLWFTQLVDDLFSRSQTLGYIGLGLLALVVLALLVVLIREILAISRQRHIALLHIDIAKAHAADDTSTARRLLRDLVSLYTARPGTARARAHISALTSEIVDGRDLIEIAERELISPLDQQVAVEIAGAAKRVSVVTAVSPRAVVDILFVGAQSIRLIRRISDIYGGRPGLLGFLKLLRSVLAHLIVTGGMAAGDSLIQQLLGQGLAARLSARLGEGVLNGFLTTRIGLSAMAVCRPMAFEVKSAPGVRDVAPFLFSGGDKE